MKVRNGFVSNSSSSSFCIYGVEMDSYEFEKKMKLIKPDLETDNIYELAEHLEIKLEVHTPSDFDKVYIGRSWSSIKDDETGKQLREGVEKELRDVFGEELKCSTQEESWYS